MSISKLFGISVLWLAASLTTASAGLIDHGSFTTDSSTGLDWLDLSESRNMSYVDVSASFGVGGAFEGFRYASVDEIKAFWFDAGILGGTPEICSPTPACFAMSEPTAVLEDFYNLVGDTTLLPLGFRGAIGLSSTPYAPPDWPGCAPSTCYVTPEFRFDDAGGIAYLFIVEGLQDGIASSAYGSWLVRTSAEPVNVSEPLTLTLFIAGIAGAGFMRRRKDGKG